MSQRYIEIKAPNCLSSQPCVVLGILLLYLNLPPTTHSQTGATESTVMLPRACSFLQRLRLSSFLPKQTYIWLPLPPLYSFPSTVPSVSHVNSPLFNQLLMFMKGSIAPFSSHVENFWKCISIFPKDQFAILYSLKMLKSEVLREKKFFFFRDHVILSGGPKISFKFFCKILQTFWPIIYLLHTYIFREKVSKNDNW